MKDLQNMQPGHVHSPWHGRMRPGALARGRPYRCDVPAGRGLRTGFAVGRGAPSPASTRQSGPASVAGTVWLCEPGLADDPCTSSLQATVVPANGARTADARDSASSAFDCFYVYPTVSTEADGNADLQVQPAEMAAAIPRRRASPGLPGLGADVPPADRGFAAAGTRRRPAANTVAYNSVLVGVEGLPRPRQPRPADRVHRPLAGRGHADPAAATRSTPTRRSAPGPWWPSSPAATSPSPTARPSGATFRHLPLCTTTDQTGCVIAYSSFPAQPPAESLFGRPGQASASSLARPPPGACRSPA